MMHLKHVLEELKNEATTCPTGQSSLQMLASKEKCISATAVESIPTEVTDALDKDRAPLPEVC